MSPDDQWAEQLAEYLRRQANLHSEIQAQLAAALRAPDLERLSGSLPGVVAAADALARLRAETEELGRRLSASIQTPLEEFREAFSQLPVRTREALRVLGEHGWYLDLDMTMPELWGIKEALEAGETEDVEEFLCAYYEARLDSIEEMLTVASPRRAHLIRAAFSAHRRGEYVLAIPVLLAQTDGVCKDWTRRNFFQRLRDGRPQVAVYVEQVAADYLRGAFLGPLVDPLPIRASYSERDESFSDLNRHFVLHGEDVDYGSRVNSFKAIALLNYVVAVLSDEGPTPPP